MLPVEKPEERDLPDLLVIFCHKQLILQHCYALLANVPTYPQERSKCSCHKMSEWIKSYIQVHGLDIYHASISVKEMDFFFLRKRIITGMFGQRLHLLMTRDLSSKGWLLWSSKKIVCMHALFSCQYLLIFYCISKKNK